MAAGTTPLWIWPSFAATPRPTIGFLASGSPETFVTVVSGFQEGLKAARLTEGDNVAIEYSWAQGQFSRLPSLAAELVQKGVDVIVTMGGNVAALAAKQATSTTAG